MSNLEEYAKKELELAFSDEKDFKQIENNLKDALEYERNLNKQILGRLDAYENIIKMMLTLLIEKASKDR